MNAKETRHASASAAIVANQMPSTPNSAGRIRTHADWKRSVRANEITAEMSPLFSAVKKLEAKMFSPVSRKENEKMENACRVSAKSSAS